MTTASRTSSILVRFSTLAPLMNTNLLQPSIKCDYWLRYSYLEDWVDRSRRQLGATASC